MRKNITQEGSRAVNGRTYIDGDWYPDGIPANVYLGESVYIDSSYGFSQFSSSLRVAMTIGKGSGCYDRASFITGDNGKIEIGEFNILNGSTFISHHSIKTGNHCMFAWGAVITDSWIDPFMATRERKRSILTAAATRSDHILTLSYNASPIIIEDNVWVGFDAVILPGTTLGRGCIVGSKSIINENIPPYAVVVGNPARIIRYLDADDTEEMRGSAFKNHSL